MMPRRSLLFIWMLIVFTFGGGATASALCLISTVTSVSTTMANLGAYTAPTTPPAQVISITVEGQYAVTLGGVGVGCSLSIFFRSTAVPGQMSISGGGTAKMPYNITKSAGGGDTLLYTGTGIPPDSNMITLSFSPPGLLGLGSYSLTFTVYGQLLPNPTQQGGSYSDDLTLTIVGDLLILLPTVAGTRPFTVLGNVTKTCTIGGTSTPTADSATIPIVGGSVVTSPIARSYANVSCNSPSTVLLSSLSGALTGPSSPGANFENQINYTATASFSGASAQLNTASVPTAVGLENGVPASAVGNMPQGTLSLTITPHSNVLPLARGNYSDTLRITITPN